MTAGVPFYKRAKKAVAAAVGLLALALTAGLLDGKAEVVGFAILAIATELGVYQARNARAAQDNPAPGVV